MVVVKETVRFWPEEQELLIDQSGLSTGVGAWAAMYTGANILVLTKPSIVVWRMEATANGAANYHGIRLRIGNWYIAGDSYFTTTLETLRAYGISYIPAGTYTVIYDGWNVNVAWLKLGVTNFSDLTGDAQDSLLNQTINAGITTTVVDQTITGTLRECCIGTIRKHVIRVQVCILCDTAGRDGEYADAGGGGVEQWDAFIMVNGTTTDWVQTAAWGTGGSNDQEPSGGVGGGNSGQYAAEFDIEDTTRIRVQIRNNEGVARDYDVYWSIAASPWLMTKDYSTPVLINIPQASNISTILESLDDNDTITKYVGLGTKKALAYSNVYNETSGTAIQQHSDVLTNLPDRGLEFYLKGWRQCVTLISADRRG